MKKFKPRNFTAVTLSFCWFCLSLFFISQNLLLGIWIPFAVVSAIIGALAVWVLFNDPADPPQH